MPTTDKRNSSVDRKSRSHYPNEGGPSEHARSSHRPQKAFTVISQTRSEIAQNIRSRSRSKALEENKDKRPRNEHIQNQEHRSLKDKTTASSRASRDLNVNRKDDKSSRSKQRSSQQIREDKNTGKQSDLTKRRSTQETHLRRDNDRTSRNVKKNDAAGDSKPQPRAHRYDDNRGRIRNEKSRNQSRDEENIRKAEHSQSKLKKSGRHENNYDLKAKTASVPVLSKTKSSSEKHAEAVVSEPKLEKTLLPEEAQDSYEYEDDFEDYESDFESDDDEDSDNNNKVDEDEEEEENDNGSGSRDEDNIDNEVTETSTPENVQEFKFQKPLNRRLSVSSFPDEKLSSIDSYEKQVLMNALKKENQNVEEYQRLRSGHERTPAKTMQIDTVASAGDGAGSRRKSFQSGPSGFINFSHAKSRQATLKELGKTLVRKMELIDSHRITLNEMVFDLFDLPPIDYDTYIRSFGKSNTKQVYSQTNEDDLHEEIQTEEIEVIEKWTQYPAHDFLGVGGEGIDSADNETLEKILKNNAERLSHFTKQAGEVMINLLEENEIITNTKVTKSDSRIDDFSQEYFELGELPFSTGNPVSFVNFSPTEPHVLLTIHGQSDEDDTVLNYHGLICVWNIYQPSLPQKYLLCSSQPLCGCFNSGKANLVFAGLLDGSVVAWDLREPSSAHRRIEWRENIFTLRFPSYITAEVLREETHHSAVVSISSSRIDSNGTGGILSAEQQLTFYIASLEEYGVLKLWTVMEVSHSNPSGSDTDLGLAPGSRIRLTCNSSINVYDLPGISSFPKTNLRTLDVRFLPNDSNQLLIATDMGVIAHVNGQGQKMIPPYYITGTDAGIVEAVSMDVIPQLSLFLVGCADGTIRLHANKKDKPLMVWPAATSHPLMQIQWATCDGTQFYVLDNQSKVHKWNLSQSTSSPAVSKDFSPRRVLHFHMNSESNVIQPVDPLYVHMAMCFDTGRIEIHKLHILSSSNQKQFLNEILY